MHIVAESEKKVEKWFNTHFSQYPHSSTNCVFSLTPLDSKLTHATSSRTQCTHMRFFINTRWKLVISKNTVMPKNSNYFTK